MTKGQIQGWDKCWDTEIIQIAYADFGPLFPLDQWEMLKRTTHRKHFLLLIQALLAVVKYCHKKRVQSPEDPWGMKSDSHMARGGRGIFPWIVSRICIKYWGEKNPTDFKDCQDFHPKHCTVVGLSGNIWGRAACLNHSDCSLLCFSFSENSSLVFGLFPDQMKTTWLYS